jgi:hypothetical protein
MPLTVKSPREVTPPAPEIVRLFTAFPPKNVDNSVIAAELLNTSSADALEALTLPVPVGELPEIVSWFAPKVKVPELKANVPPTLTLPAMFMPFARFIVKSFKVTAGKIVAAPVPPNTMFDVTPPVRVPDVE